LTLAICHVLALVPKSVFELAIGSSIEINHVGRILVETAAEKP
jgi:hypothetical protein